MAIKFVLTFCSLLFLRSKTNTLTVILGHPNLPSLTKTKILFPTQDIREICLKKWDVPNEMRKRRLRERPMETAERLLNSTLFRGSTTT